MIPLKKRKKGFIAIVSLLIVSTVAMFYSLSMLKDGISNASLSLDSIFYENARMNANNCLEDLLLRIRKESEFSKDLSYNFSSGDSCSASPTWFGSFSPAIGVTERLLSADITGLSHGFSRSFHYEMRIATYDVNYSNGDLDHMNTIDFISITED